MSWSPSRSVSSFFGTDKSYEAKDDRNVLSGVLAELNRSANMISNANAGEAETHFTVNFSNGVQKAISDNSMDISPDVLVTKSGALKTGEHYYEAMDALNGRAIIGTYIRRNHSKAEFNKFQGSKDDVAKVAFQASNEGNAREAISSDWTGFKPYLDAHKDLCHTKKSSITLPKKLAQEEAENIFNMANYNLLNPDDKIQTGNAKIDDAVNRYTDMIDGSWDSCVRASHYIRELLHLEDSPELPPPPAAGDGKGDDKDDKKKGQDKQKGDGKGDNEKGDKKDDKGDGQGGKSDDKDGEKDSGDKGQGKGDKGKDGGKQDGDGDADGGDADGEDGDGDKGSGKGEKSDKPATKVKPKLNGLGDNSLMGQKVDTTRPDWADVSGDPSDDACKVDAYRTVLDDTNYQPDYEQVSKNVYKKRIAFLRQGIAQVEKCFLFQENQNAIYTRGLTTGDLDDANLWKIGFDKEFVYERKDIAKQPEHTIGILLDQSGSMGTEKMRDAADVCIMLLEGLKSYRSIKKIVYGHSGQERNETDCIMIPYVTAKQDFGYRLSTAQARRQNFDGLAIKYIADRMLEVPVDGKRFLFVVSDGQPAAHGYGGWEAIKHTEKCVKDARKRGVKVFGIGIQNAFDNRMGEALYGKGNFIVLSDTKSSLRVMVAKLKQFLASV